MWGQWIGNATEMSHQIHVAACPVILSAIEPLVHVHCSTDLRLNIGVKLSVFLAGVRFYMYIV